MCFELPFKIIDIKDKEAVVDCIGQKYKVNLELVKDVKIGDYVMVQGNLAIDKVKRAEAEEILDLLKNEKEGKEDEKR